MSPPPTPIGFLGGIGWGEMIVIVFLSILVFGGRLPEVLRNLGRSYAKFRQGLNDLSKPIRDEIQQVTALSDAPTPRPALLPPTTAPTEGPAGPQTSTTYPADAPPADTVAPGPEAGARPWPTAETRPDPFEEPPPV